MNNKYNVRAIRDELDTYIRCNAWNKFRKRFVSLLSIESNDGQQQQQQRSSLCRAVIEYSNNKCSFNNYNKGNTTTGRNSLLHVLCRRFNSSPEHPVPMDMIELIGQTCPKLFAKIIISDDTPAKSPFMILLDRGAPPFLIERIIQILYDYDKNNHNDRDGDGDDNKIKPISKNRNKNKNKNNVLHPSLVMQCLVGKDSKGNTPLLHAIKYQDCPDMLRTLVKYDKYGQSLLTTSKKGQIPLYYLVQQAMRELGQYYNISSRTTTVLFDTTQLPENLVYMLRKTQRAIYVEQHGTSHNFDFDSDSNRVGGRYDDHDVDDDDNECHDYDFNDDGNFNDDYDNDDDDDDNGLLFERSTKHHQSVDSVLVFQAAICCVHYLNERHRLSLFRWLLMLLLEEDFTAVDNDGNTYHHLICYAHESQCFIDDDKYDGDNNMTLNNNNNNKNNSNSNSNSNDENNNNSTSLLQFLTSKHPESLSMYNNDGKIPLHVGIEQKKDWKYLEYLIRLAPESGRIPTTRTVTTTTTTTTTRHMRSLSHSPLSSFSREKRFQQYQQQSQQLGGQLPLHLVLLQYNGGSCDDHRRYDRNKSSSTSASNNSCNASIHTTTETTTNTYYNAKEIIIGLWKIYPEAALMKDPTTNLYPFQSLAVASVSSPSVASSSSSSPSSSRVRGDGTKRKNNGRKSRPSTNTISGSIEQTTMMMTEMIENQSKEQLSIVYQFLRQAPEVLQLLI